MLFNTIFFTEDLFIHFILINKIIMNENHPQIGNIHLESIVFAYFLAILKMEKTLVLCH